MSGPAPRVFLSHSSKDQEFVAELYRRLTGDGVACFFSPESIGWGDNWVKALERALDECEYVVFLLSPDFCNSRWVEVERTSSIADDPAGLKRRVRPLILQPCDHLPTFPRFLRHIQTIDISTPTAFETNYPGSVAAWAVRRATILPSPTARSFRRRSRFPSVTVCPTARSATNSSAG